MIWTYGSPVRVAAKLGVAGKVAADFTIKLTEDGAASTLTVTVTELTVLGTGVYMFSFTPPDSSTKKHYALRVTYGSPGDDYYIDSLWDVDVQPPVGGQTLRLEVQGDTGLTILQACTKDGNTDAGVTFTITEDTDFGTGIYAAVATLPESEVPYTLAVRLYDATGSVDTTFTVNVQPSYNNLLNLETVLREALGNPAYSELTYSQAQRAWTRALQVYSRFKPREDFDTSITTTNGTKDYTLPDNTLGVFACKVAAALADITDNLDDLYTARETLGHYTGYSDMVWQYVNGKLRLLPTPTTTGLYLGLVLWKEHVFSNGTCTTISQAEMETLVLKGAMAEALRMMAGYEGTVRFGSAMVDKEPLREEANRLEKEYREDLARAIT